MGWMYTNRPANVTPTEFLRSRIDCDNEHGTWNVLESHVTLRVGYFAVECLVKATGEKYVFAAVFLIHHCHKGDTNYNFGYKDMDESYGPNESNCPQKILDLLSPTDHEYALEWRERCRKNLAEREERRKKIRSLMLKKGDIVEFAEEISFSGEKRARFMVLDLRRNLFSDPVSTWRRYKISNWRDREFSVLKENAKKPLPHPVGQLSLV